MKPSPPKRPPRPSERQPFISWASAPLDEALSDDMDEQVYGHAEVTP